MDIEGRTINGASVRELAAQIISTISPAEWRGLEVGDLGGQVSAFNRETLLRLHDLDTDGIPRGSLDGADVERMAELLGSFLDSHMSDNPAAHRWIVLSCLALAFVFREPLHPVKVVKAEVHVADGEAIYYCPVREGDETLCGYCPCRPIAELRDAQQRAVELTRREHGGMAAGIQDVLQRAGMSQMGVLPVNALAFREEVRAICAGNLCGSYDSCWACPPAVGSLEECRARCLAFDAAMLFSRAYLVEDAFDFEGMTSALGDFKKRVIGAAPMVRERAGEVLVLSNEGCGICAECTWPDAPCRFPDRCLHSIEGYGLTVSEVAEIAGLRYSNGANTVTFFGAVLYRE